MAMVASLFAITILAFLVWAHHMFVTGLNPFLGSVFVLLTLLIAVPSAIKVFNWLTTIWRAKYPVYAGHDVRSWFREPVHLRWFNRYLAG